MSLKSYFRTLLTLGTGVVRGIPEATADRDPIGLFKDWFAAATDAGVFMPEAMALGTATPDGAPSVRMVLLKTIDQRGFVFYTNYGSRKAVELESNSQASVCFHWAVLQRQVRVDGRVERVSHEESFRYYSSRSRGSRVGAWASRQSQPLASREELQERVRRFDKEYAGDAVPLPPFWGGYLLRPEVMEFWQGKANRLHDRLVFERSGDGWKTVRLYP